MEILSVIITGAVVLFLAGCSPNSIQQNNNASSSSGSLMQSPSEWYRYDNDRYMYSVKVPSVVISHNTSMDDYAGFGTFSILDRKPGPQDFTIGIQGLSRSSPCSPSLTGASHTTPLQNANGESEWGKVDVFELQRLEGWQPEYDLSTVLCTSSLPVVYALCSTNGENTVVMCISEQTDNPALAKQIFETFQWTK